MYTGPMIKATLRTGYADRPYENPANVHCVLVSNVYDRYLEDYLSTIEYLYVEEAVEVFGYDAIRQVMDGDTIDTVISPEALFGDRWEENYIIS